jgi:hypothetical protein
MRRLLLPILTIAALIGVPALAVTAAVPTVHLEAQSWWAKDGISVPSAVGHHIHVEALNFPRPGTIMSGTYNLRVKVTLHDQAGATNIVRVQNEGSYVKSVPFVLGPCADCSAEVTIPIDFDAMPSGIRELRITANVPDEQPETDGAQRMFNSTGWPVCVDACSPSYRPDGLKHVEARGWYEDHDYQNAQADDFEVDPGQVLAVELNPGSGGGPTTYSGVFVNPSFHNGIAGRVLLERNGAYEGNVTIPNDVQPGDKIVLLASDGKNAGVLVLRVTGTATPTPTPTAPPTPSPTPVPTPEPTPDPTITPAPTPVCVEPTAAP